MVRVLAVSDEVDEVLANDARSARGAELILACGDLPFEYLAHLMDQLDVPPGSRRCGRTARRTRRMPQARDQVTVSATGAASALPPRLRFVPFSGSNT